ncbi:MAG: mechanosensitive ion channel family protein [Gaiellales bacterium]
MVRIVDLPGVHLSSHGSTVVVIAAAFVVAALVSRFSARLARRIVGWSERRSPQGDSASTGVIMGIRRRETAVSLVQTTVRYVAFGTAVVIAFSRLAGGTAATLAGASVIVVLVGFAGQRFLTDILAGLFMFFEGWFAVGDTVVVEPWGLTGVVEEVSLRATKLRSLGGDVIRINNSQILSLRLLPRAAREVQIEAFFTDEETAHRVFEDIVRIVPVGPTNFVRAPWLKRVDRLGDDVVRLTAGAFVPPGREWLANDLLASLMHERADGQLVHGPVVTEFDSQAAARYGRSSVLLSDRTPDHARGA